MNNITVEVTIMEGYIPTINDKKCAKICKDVVENMDGIELVNVTEPSMATEDFSYLLKKIKGCYVWLGAGGESLHSSTYDFNDNVLNIGFEYFKDLVMYRLPRKNNIISSPSFGDNLVFLGFICLPSDYTLDMEIGSLLGQVDGVGWRIKKLPCVGCTNINKENFKKLKHKLEQTAFDFIPNSKYPYGKLSVLSVACTSMSFVLGRSVIDEELRKGYNVKTNDTTTSILEAINMLNSKKLKVSLLTPYIDNVHNKYKKLMEKNNCEIVVEHNMNLENDSLTSSVTLESIKNIINEMISLNSEIYLFIIVCSALNVTKKGFIDEMEKKYGIFFLTSNQCLFWNSLRVALNDNEKHKIGGIKGYGKLFTFY